MTLENSSFAEFKKATYHKKVKYIWHKRADDTIVKEFETDKFYCNPYGKGENRMLSMPKFNLSATNCEWKKDTIDDSYWHFSEYGETQFKVIGV